MSVSIEAAATRNVSETFEAGGVVRARLTANIASRMLAPISAVNCVAGDRVPRGRVLVTLDDRETRAGALAAKASFAAAVETARAAKSDVRSAESTFQLAQATHDRVKTLYGKGSATPHELDEAVSARATAEAAVSSARARAAAAESARQSAESAFQASEAVQSYSTLLAPFDAVVAERLADPGSMAVPGATLLVLEDPSELRLEVALDAARAGNVRVGQVVDLRLDGVETTNWRPGRVVEISRIDPASHDFLVKVDIPDHRLLRPGMFGRVRVAGNMRGALTVPAASVVRRGQLSFVFAIDGGVARLRAVVEGVTAEGYAEILAGIKAGDQIVVNPPEALTDGTPVNGRRR